MQQDKVPPTGNFGPQRKKKKRKGPLIVLILGLLIGIGFIVYQPLMDWLAGQKAVEIAKKVEAFKEGEKPVANGDKEIEAGVGLVEIPSVGISLAIYPATVENALDYGAKIEVPTMNIGDNNLVLAGHSSWQPNYMFSGIDRMNNGDDIFVYDEFAKYSYKKTKDYVIFQDDLKILEQPTDGKKVIHLFNCYPKNDLHTNQRFVVEGDLINVELTEKGKARQAEEDRKSAEQKAAEIAAKEKEREDALRDLTLSGR